MVLIEPADAGTGEAMFQNFSGLPDEGISAVYAVCKVISLETSDVDIDIVQGKMAAAAVEYGLYLIKKCVHGRQTGHPVPFDQVQIEFRAEQKSVAHERVVGHPPVPDMIKDLDDPAGSGPDAIVETDQIFKKRIRGFRRCFLFRVETFCVM